MKRFLIQWLALACAALALAGCTREMVLSNANGRAVVRERGVLLGNWQTTATLHADGTMTATDARDKGPVESVASMAAGLAAGALASGVILP